MGWFSWLGDLIGWSVEPSQTAPLPESLVTPPARWRLSYNGVSLGSTDGVATWTVKTKPAVRPKKRLASLLKDGVPPPLAQPQLAPWLAYHDWVLEHRGDDQWLVGKVKRIVAGLSLEPQLRLAWNGFVVTVAGCHGPNEARLGSGQFRAMLLFVAGWHGHGFASRRIRWLSHRYVRRYQFRGCGAADTISTPADQQLAEQLPQLAWEYYLRVARDATGKSLEKFGWTP